ncbi:Uncharacterized protein PCOAH_00021230 [Plasmodium coatneyi]|uniref:Plasmodium RESA N-terminal domain-containing protein n=1 Tax=Plasmodium coatneyi TaxID=208452 RepID=A0A1B1DZ21_9APIC|nr:Uncharacterized protein PCOAH_00021230 [Plasmodium coatneyi]ANQ07980.1 Uncharacterized protein PCOAH_00021230 [Plasmodium coatneyi]
MAVRSSESGVDEKKNGIPGGSSCFFTKRTAMLFFVLAFIFLKHQDDFARQNAAATLQVRNRIARNLKANTETAPSEEELESHEDDEENYGNHPEEMYEEYEEEGYSDDEQEEEVSEEEDEERPAEKEEEVREEVYPQEESIVEHDDAREENSAEREIAAEGEQVEQPAQYVQEEEDNDDSISGSQSNVTSCWKCFKRSNHDKKKKKKEKKEDAPFEREEEAPVEWEEEAPVEREEGTAEGGRYLREEEEKMVHEGAYFDDVPKEQVSQEVAEGAQVNEQVPVGEQSPEGGRQYVDEGRKMGGGEGAPNVKQEVEPAEQRFPLFGERTNYVADADLSYYAHFVNLYKNAYNDDKKKKKEKKERKEEELDDWEITKLKWTGHDESDYLEYIPKDNKRSLRYDEEEHIDDEDGMNELLFEEFKKWENYGTHKNGSFCYEMSCCFDERLTDKEINKELKEMDKFPKKCELISLYWQSFLNERSRYINANKRLFKKFLELKKKQNFETISGYKNKWKKCSKIVGNNFKEQREHVNDIFYTSVVKENLSRDEFKEILNDVRDSWKEVTLKVTDECVAILEEPIVPEVKVIDHNSYYGEGSFRVTRLSSPHPSS